MDQQGNQALLSTYDGYTTPKLFGASVTPDIFIVCVHCIVMNVLYQ